MAQTDIEIQEDKMNWHWRNSMRPVRFFSLDARAAFPFCVLLFYFRPSSLIVTVLITMVFQFLEKRGLTFPASMRALRVWILGSRRPGLASLRRRRARDYG